MIHGFTWAIGYHYDPGPPSAIICGGVERLGPTAGSCVYFVYRAHTVRHVYQNINEQMEEFVGSLKWDRTAGGVTDTLEQLRKIMDAKLLSKYRQDNEQFPISMSIGGFAICGNSLRAFRRGAFGIRLGEATVLDAELLEPRKDASFRSKAEEVYAKSLSSENFLERPLQQEDFLTVQEDQDKLSVSKESPTGNKLIVETPPTQPGKPSPCAVRARWWP